MNIEVVKEDLSVKLGSKVSIKVKGLRNKSSTYVGTLLEVYPYIFTVLADGENKSFSYADVITGDVEITYL